MQDYGMVNHYVPLIAPVDLGDTSIATPYVDMAPLLGLTFVVMTGVLTGGATTALETVTIESSSTGSSNASEAAVVFNYRLSSAVGTDSLGAVTAATTAGKALTMSDDGKMLIVNVDPATVAAGPTTKLGRYCRLVITKSATMSVALVSVLAVGRPRNMSATMVSTSAA
jgi:hypothetical protein